MMVGLNSLLRVFILAPVLAFLAEPASADEYHVSFSTERADDDGALRRAEVVAILKPDRGRIRMTRAAEDSGLFNGWAGFLTGLQAEDAKGRALKLENEGPGVWRVQPRARGEITVHYSINLQHDRFRNEPGDDELAYARPWGVMWTGRALFLEGAPSDDITVNFDLPDGWKVTTPWRRAGEEATQFTPSDTDDLLDSAFMAGTHEETIIELGEAKALIALDPQVQQFRDMFHPLIKTYFSAYSALFDDTPKENFLLIGADASFLGGGVMGRTISLSLNDDAAGPQGQFIAAYIISHEGFHLWNAQWGSQNESAGELEWLSEGAAEYYAFLTSLRLGLIDEDTYWSLVAERYGAYLAALNKGKTLTSAATTKNTSSTSYDLIYSGGMTALLFMDLEIRNASNGEKSLDDVMRAVHARYSTGEEKPTLRSLTKLIKAATGVDFRQFFRTHIRQATPIDLGVALDAIGMAANAGESGDEVTAVISATPERTPAQSAAYKRFIKNEL